MEIKTTEEIRDIAEDLVERSGHFNNKLSGWDKKWVAVNDLISDIEDWNNGEGLDTSQIIDKLNELAVKGGKQKG